MKCTIEISDALLAQIKKLAAREGVTVDALVELGLRQILVQRHRIGAPFRLRDASFKGQGLSAQAKGATWDALREQIYDGRNEC